MPTTELALKTIEAIDAAVPTASLNSDQRGDHVARLKPVEAWNCDIVTVLPDVWLDAEKIKLLTDVELVQHYSKSVQIGRMAREVRITFFDEMCRRFKNYTKKREGIPTLECAFSDYGLNYDTERQAVYREKKRLQEDLTPNLPNKKEETQPPFKEGEMVFPFGKNTATVVHDRSTTGNVLVDEVASGDVDNPVRKEYKRGDLITLAEKLAQDEEATDSTKKKSKKQALLDQEAVDNAYYADRYFALLGLLLNAPKDTPADIIIKTMQREAEAAHSHLDAEQAKRIKTPKLVKPPKVDPETTNAKLREQVAELKREVATQTAELKEVQSRCKTLSKQASVGTLAAATHASGGSIIGVKSEPTPNGYYWEGRKHATHPYVVKNSNYPHIPIMKECKTRTEAEQYVNDREKEAVTAKAKATTI